MVKSRSRAIPDLYAAFLTDVSIGNIRPGERLGEQSLAARWKVGRVPVRETLLRLEHDGLVVRLPNSGTFVREIDKDEVLELYDIRIGIEPKIAFEAATLATKAQAAKLTELAELADKLEDDGLERASRDRAFHAELCEVSQRRHSSRIISLARLHLRCSTIYQRVQVLGTYTVSQPDHRPIAAAVKAHEPERAQQLMLEHLEAAKAAIVKDMKEIDRMYQRAQASA